MNTIDEIKAFIEKYDVAVVGYFTANTTEEAVAFTAAAAGSSEHVQFAMCTCSDTTKGMETEANTVILYKKVNHFLPYFYVCLQLTGIVNTFVFLSLNKQLMLFVSTNNILFISCHSNLIKGLVGTFLDHN